MQTYQKHLEEFDAYLTLKNFSKATRNAYGCAPVEYSLCELHGAGSAAVFCLPGEAWHGWPFYSETGAGIYFVPAQPGFEVADNQW